VDARGGAVIVAVCANAAIDVTYTVPVLLPGEAHRVAEVRERAGGKGINVARVLHQLGQDVTVCGFAGGVAGAAIIDDLTVSGIAQALTPIAGESRRAVAVVAQDQATVFNEQGPHIADEEWRRLVADVGAASLGAEVVVLSGSIPPGAPASGYAQLVGLAQRHGATVIVDAAGDALGHALEAAPEIVKPNASEAAALLGRPVVTREDARDAGLALLRRGANAAVVSRGPAGLIAVRTGEAIEARLPRRVDGNPTGAGDALAAALARGLSSGATWRETLCDAAAISAAAVAEPVAGGFVQAVADELRPAIELEEF
jgi:tagatose 6-phosphate kinase